MEGVKALDIGKDRVGVADVYVVAVHRPARAAPCGVRCYARLVGLVIPNSVQVPRDHRVFKTARRPVGASFSAEPSLSMHRPAPPPSPPHPASIAPTHHTHPPHTPTHVYCEKRAFF